VLSLDAVIARLEELLPPTFEDLDRDFAVGVVTAEGEHLLIDSGPLPAAVAASAAIPYVFSSVDVPGARAAAASLSLACRAALGAALGAAAAARGRVRQAASRVLSTDAAAGRRASRTPRCRCPLPS
jgi:hypothetical protein